MKGFYSGVAIALGLICAGSVATANRRRRPRRAQMHRAATAAVLDLVGHQANGRNVTVVIDGLKNRGEVLRFNWLTQARGPMPQGQGTISPRVKGRGFHVTLRERENLPHGTRDWGGYVGPDFRRRRATGEMGLFIHLPLK